jgi:hypothetical protein
MTKDRYLNMCEQLNQEPDPERMPPGIEDFPDIVIEAINTYNGLSDNVAAEIGFIGKDYTNLPQYMEIYEVEDKELFLEILNYLESRAIKHSQEMMKKERDKLKRKSSGR